MSEPVPFIRKVAAGVVESLSRSWPVAITASLRFGSGEVAKIGGGTLASRTDEQGNIEPYPADDPEVLRKLFGVEVG